jgi:hypothetical protein
MKQPKGRELGIKTLVLQNMGFLKQADKLLK